MLVSQVPGRSFLSIQLNTDQDFQMEVGWRLTYQPVHWNRAVVSVVSD